MRIDDWDLSMADEEMEVVLPTRRHLPYGPGEDEDGG